MHRGAAVARACEAILASRRAIITTHINADGDGAGSEAALASWMRANGTEVAIVNPTVFPQHFHWMLEDPGTVFNVGSAAARDRCAAADLAIVVDTCDATRIGTVWRLITGLRTLVVDHHQPGGRPIGGVHLCDPKASAAGELVYDLMRHAHGPWTKHALDGLYVAISTDTGSYRFDNASPEAHLISAELIARGVRPAEVNRRLHGSVPLRKYELMRRALGTLRTEGGVSWMIVPPDAYRELGCRNTDLEGLVDIPRSVEGTEVGILFRLTVRGEVKASFRAVGDVDVSELARSFGGGGHRKASGALIVGSPDAAIEAVLRATRASLARKGVKGLVQS